MSGGSVKFIFLMEGLRNGKECFKWKKISWEEVLQLDFVHLLIKFGMLLDAEINNILFKVCDVHHNWWIEEVTKWPNCRNIWNVPMCFFLFNFFFIFYCSKWLIILFQWIGTDKLQGISLMDINVKFCLYLYASSTGACTFMLPSLKHAFLVQLPHSPFILRFINS